MTSHNIIVMAALDFFPRSDSGRKRVDGLKTANSGGLEKDTYASGRGYRASATLSRIGTYWCRKSRATLYCRSRILLLDFVYPRVHVPAR